MGNIDIDAETDNKYIGFNLEFKKKHLDIVLEIVTHALRDFKVDKLMFQNEKNSIIEELNEIIDDNMYTFNTIVSNNIYNKHNRAISQKERLKKCKTYTEEDLQEYYRKYVTPSNVVIGLAGNL